MKTTRYVLFALLLLSSVAGVASAQTSVAAGIHIGPSGRASVDLGFFYDDLAPYGNWIERPSYGWVWTPRAVSTSWRPYEDGHWVWTDEGWVWITDEPYGWATYHYGRWYDDPEIGWAWVPGDEWGPSWVSWQAGGDYVGWAPLPPGVNVSVSVGGGYGGYAYGIAPEDYLFVPERDFLAPRLATYIVPTARVRGFWGQTRNFTNYRFNGGRVFNQGIPVDQVQRFVGRRVPRYQVADLGGTDFKRYRGGARIQGNRLAMFRPQVQKARVAPPIQRAAARRAVVSAARFKAAHPQRVAFAQRQNNLARQERQQVRQQRAEARGGAPALNPRGKALQQRQAQVAQRQARVAQQQARVNRAQQRQAQTFRQQQKVQQRQTRVDQRQARIAQQRVRVDRAQQRQAQAFRQQKVQQQRQTRVDQRQARVAQQRVRIDRAQQRQAQAFRQQQRQAQRPQFQAARQQQRQAMQQQRAAQRQGGGGRGQGQGGGGHRGHNRPPGR